MNQTAIVLDHFRATPTKGISNVEAQAIYKIRALPRRIADLIEQGHAVYREMRMDNTGQRYKRYWLLPEGARNIERGKPVRFSTPRRRDILTGTVLGLDFTVSGPFVRIQREDGTVNKVRPAHVQC